MPLSPIDRDRLQQALQLAEQAIGTSDPNPRVGCVIGTAQGDVLGRGATQQAGQAHAEVMALRDAAAAGHDVRGATAWVTLEPCAHHGRTPPCCDALVAAGIARVVVAVGDPFPQVAGAGIARLRAAGIEVAMADDDLASAARELNIGFFSRIERGRPWVRMKIAASWDGRTALPDGTSQWITGEAARADGHAWRRRAGAVVTGIGTALADDPRLDVRHVPTVLQPLRVVVDSHFRLPPSARLLQPPGDALVCGCDTTGAARMAAQGVPALLLPRAEGGGVDLQALLGELGRRAVNEVHVEAGARLNGAWLRTGLVDELLLYQGGMLLGAGRPMAELGPYGRLADAPAFRAHDVAVIGPDLRVRLRGGAWPPVSAALTSADR